MTLTELQAKRDEILETIGIAKTSSGSRSVEYVDAQKALDLIDREIAALSPESTTTSRTTTYAVFKKG